MSVSEYLTPIISVIFIVIGGFSFGWFKILRQTNELLKEQNIELKAENKEWKVKHDDNARAISDLQGQIKILKSIPLAEIASGLKAVGTSNAAILRSLKKTAVIAAEDRDVLTNQNKHIRDEVKRITKE